MAVYEADGREYEYDVAEAKSYGVATKLVKAAKEPDLVFEVAEALFGENAEAYWNELGGSLEAYANLVADVFNSASKN